MESKKLGARFWFSLLLVGLVGQLAWAIENNYINLWVYSQTGNTDAITWMTVTSALAATLTTFFVGLWSDRVGKRKLFINIGYIVWGVSVFTFGLCSYHNLFSLTKEQASAILWVGITMTLLDNIMTFFGSTSNDACFNAWVTEHTDESNRGKVESILSVLPLAANVFMIGIGIPLHIGAVPDDFLKGQINDGIYPDSAAALAHGWFYYFLICGILVTVIGVISIFLLPKDEIQPNREESYGKKLFYGFRPSVIKQNSELYLLLLTFFGFNSAINAFMPYYLVYFQNDASVFGAGFGSSMDFYIAFGIILITASLITILIGAFLMNKANRYLLFYVSIGVAMLGAIGLFFAGTIHWLDIVCGIFLITGYLLCTAILGAAIRDKTPVKDVGLFQGVRMIFAVLLPMVTGPLISQAFFPTSSYQDPTNPALGGKTPSRVMFLVALAFFFVALAPMIVLHVKTRHKEKPQHENVTHRDA